MNSVDFEKRETVRIRNRYDASVPTVVGTIGVASDVIETPEEVADTLREALQCVDADKLYPPPTAALSLSRRVANGKLKARAQAWRSCGKNWPYGDDRGSGSVAAGQGLRRPS